MEPTTIIMLGGILPFGSIFIEMYDLNIIICYDKYFIILGILFSHHFGHTRSTMSMDLCCS